MDAVHRPGVGRLFDGGYRPRRLSAHASSLAHRHHRDRQWDRLLDNSRLALVQRFAITPENVGNRKGIFP